MCFSTSVARWIRTFNVFAHYIGMPQHEKQDRAECLFKAREQQKADAPAEYHATIQRTRDFTDELRWQRLAREARKAQKQVQSR